MGEGCVVGGELEAEEAAPEKGPRDRSWRLDRFYQAGQYRPVLTHLGALRVTDWETWAGLVRANDLGTVGERTRRRWRAEVRRVDAKRAKAAAAKERAR